MFWTISAGIAAFGLWYYWDNAIGCSSRVSSTVPRLPSHIPFFGGVYLLIKNYDIVNHFLEAELNKPGFKASVMSIPFSDPIFYVNDPESLEYVLSKKFDSFGKAGFVYNLLTDLLGNGIFVSDGHEWLFQRKVASRIFTTRAFRHIFDTVFSDNIAIFFGILDDTCEQKVVIDIQELLLRFFTDSFGKIAFGADIKSLLVKNEFAKVFERAQYHLQARVSNPLFKLTEPKLVTEDFKKVGKFALSIIDKRRNELVSDRAIPDLLDLFMQHRDEHGEPLTDEQLTDHVISFMFAGRDTTAQTLSWTIYCLTKYPHVTAKLLAEAQEVMGDATFPTYDQVRQLKYAHAVFQETLRLYCPVSRNCKVANQDEVLPNGTFIPKGAVVSWSAWAMGRSSKIWENPLEYYPERWLDGKTHSAFKNPVFHAGPRICLGKALAELQGVFVLVSIIKNYDIQVLEPETVTYSNTLTMPIKGGLHCSIKKRQ